MTRSLTFPFWTENQNLFHIPWISQTVLGENIVLDRLCRENNQLWKILFFFLFCFSVPFFFLWAYRLLYVVYIYIYIIKKKKKMGPQNFGAQCNSMLSLPSGPPLFNTRLTYYCWGAFHCPKIIEGILYYFSSFPFW